MWFLFKALLAVTIAVIVRGVLPRFRIDQLVSEHWKMFIFMYIFFVLELISVIYFNFI